MITTNTPSGQTSAKHTILSARLYDTLFTLFAFALLAVHGYVWQWVEGLSLFLPDADFFRQFLYIPGGMTAYAGCFLTQSLHYPVVGSLLFVALLLLVQRLTVAVFRLPKACYPLSFLPSFLLLTAVLNMGYTWITLKAPGHFFAPTLGCCFFLACAYLYQRIKHTGLRLLFALLLLASYPLFGFYALCAGGLCLLSERAMQANEKKYACMVAVGIALIWLVPQVCYYTFDSTQQEISRMYLAGMPTFFVRRAELMLWMPFLLLFGCYLLLALLAFFTPSGRACPPRLKRWGPAVCYLAFMVFTVSQTYRNENFEAAVRASLAIEEEDWGKVLEATRQVKGSPTRDVAIDEKLALTLLGRPQVQSEMPPLLEVYKDSRPGFLTFTQLCGLPMLYYMGQTNLCYRWGMEISVEYGWRPACLKYMVRCALLQGETALARKYNDLLKRTAFHKEWAERYQPYIDQPELIHKSKEFTRIAEMAKTMPDMFID